VDSFDSEQGPVTDFCVHCNKRSSSLKCKKFL